ncbi:MAG: matrixin family metalloprotease [Deltaproteobacteria bacterium]|nr:MAG: matrixin family metalloprotease [Deltaproteobacteria bacterium]
MNPARRRVRALGVGLLLCGVGGGLALWLRPGAPALPSATGAPPYEPTRADYAAFRARHPRLIEPNYLPFMLHRVQLGGRELLVVCRWADDRSPLPVHIESPRIPASLQDEVHPQTADAYAQAARRALAEWQRGLEGLVRFRTTPVRREAALRVRLIGKAAPHPDASIKVLGATSMRDACRATGGDPASERIEVRFEVPEVRVYLADEFGLLNPSQIERVVLHELGHALGMYGHSRRITDLMHESLPDVPTVENLSMQDVNSFVTLYQLPNGTVYRRGPWGEAPAAAAAPSASAPELAIAPHVDARHGFELHPPAGWMRIELPTGMVALDGVSWDFDATFQVMVRNYPTIESYVERHAAAHLGDAWVVGRQESEVAGRRALRFSLRRPRGALVEELTFIEVGDGRLFIVSADCPSDRYEAYRPWFDAALASLEIREPTSAPGVDGVRAAPVAPVPEP